MHSREMDDFRKISEHDNVAIALRVLQPETKLSIDGADITINNTIGFGHKFALSNIKRGELIIKYGETIGRATEDIKRGDHVHTHNLVSMRGRRIA